MAQDSTLPAHDFSDLSFEQGMAELEQLVAQLEAPNIGLEESVKLYERGQALQIYLSSILKNTEMRIEKIGQSALHTPAAGTPATATSKTVTAAENPAPDADESLLF